MIVESIYLDGFIQLLWIDNREIERGNKLDTP